MNENQNLLEAAKAQALALEITIAAAGESAFNSGKGRAPALDLPIELASPRNLRAWLTGWDRANLACPVAEKDVATARLSEVVSALDRLAPTVRPAPGTKEAFELRQKERDCFHVGGNEMMAFAQAVQNNILAVDRVSFPTLNPVQVKVTWGKRYARLSTARNPGNDDCAYCFVEIATGNILKCAGWKAPAKHARGNIRNGDQSNWWCGALNAHGAAYLK